MSGTQFWQAYLYAFIFWISLSLGCLGMMMLHHVVRSTWGKPILRIFEAGAKMLPLMAVLFFIGVAGGMLDIYPWTHPDIVRGDAIMEAKTWLLNRPGFLIRAGIYFFIWIVCFLFPLLKWSYDEDRTGDPTLEQKRVNLSAFGIVVFFLMVTLVFTDWVMSLDKHWYSTIYGFWFVVGDGLLATAFATFYVMRRVGKPPYTPDVVTVRATRDFGNLLLMFTMFWAYMTVSQFLLQWSGNLPDEVAYYYTRTQPGWREMGTLVVIGNFFAPFLALLSSRTKRTPRLLYTVAGWIVFIRAVDLYWNIIPTYPNRHDFSIAPLDVLVTLGIGAIWYALFRWQLAQRPLVPQHGHRRREALENA